MLLSIDLLKVRNFRRNFVVGRSFFFVNITILSIFVIWNTNKIYMTIIYLSLSTLFDIYYAVSLLCKGFLSVWSIWTPLIIWVDHHHGGSLTRLIDFYICNNYLWCGFLHTCSHQLIGLSIVFMVEKQFIFNKIWNVVRFIGYM